MPSQPQAKGRVDASSVPGLMRRILVVVAVSLLLGACGDDDDEATQPHRRRMRTAEIPTRTSKP